MSSCYACKLTTTMNKWTNTYTNEMWKQIKNAHLWMWCIPFCMTSCSYEGMASTIGFSLVGSCGATYFSLPIVSLACSCASTSSLLLLLVLMEHYSASTFLTVSSCVVAIRLPIVGSCVTTIGLIEDGIFIETSMYFLFLLLVLV